MAARRTNLELLVLLVAALGTGALAFATGTSIGWGVTVAHGVVGLGLVVLSPWKALMLGMGAGKIKAGTALRKVVRLDLAGVVGDP
jgi:hypothetical protein